MAFIFSITGSVGNKKGFTIRSDKPCVNMFAVMKTIVSSPLQILLLPATGKRLLQNR